MIPITYLYNLISHLKFPSSSSQIPKPSQTPNEETLSLNNLFTELKKEIATRMDTDTIATMRHVSKEWKDLVDDKLVWQIVAEKLGLNKESNAKQVQEYVAKTRQQVRRVINPDYEAAGALEYKGWVILQPVEVAEILKQPPTIESTKLLRDYLSANDILSFWRALAKESNLEDPDMSNLDTIPKMVEKANEFNAWFVNHLNQATFRGIYEVDIEHLQMTTLPSEIGMLTALHSINAIDNQLETIPKEIGNLRFLHLFFLQDNPLKSLPDEIGSIPSLEIRLPKELEGQIEISQKLENDFISNGSYVKWR